MDDETREHAVELLQELGLKEYEAKCFVALSRVPKATAKEISDLSEVPRTRVYDAARVLEAQGLVEVQHANPQEFRAVSNDEAIETLRERYDSRIETLRADLRALDRPEEAELTHEVWSLSGDDAIANRTTKLIAEADDEAFLVLGDRSAFTADLAEALNDATERGVSVVVGTMREELHDHVADAVADAEVFVSELRWLQGIADTGDHEVTVNRLLLVDNEQIFVSTAPDERHAENAVFARGVTNGFVIVARRLMATGLLESEDPGLDTT